MRDLQKEQHRTANSSLAIARIERAMWDSVRSTELGGRGAYLHNRVRANPTESTARSSLLKVSLKLTQDLWDQVDRKELSILEACRIGCKRDKEVKKQKKNLAAASEKKAAPEKEVATTTKPPKPAPEKVVATTTKPPKPAPEKVVRSKPSRKDTRKKSELTLDQVWGQFRLQVETLVSTGNRPEPEQVEDTLLLLVAPEEIQALVLGMHKTIYEHIKQRFPAKRNSTKISRAVRSFLASFDDDLRLLANRLERCQITSEILDFEAFVAAETKIPQAFAELGFENVNLSQLPDRKVVKKRFKTLTYQLHPDRYQGPDPSRVTAQFQNLQNSYHIVENCYVHQETAR